MNAEPLCEDPICTCLKPQYENNRWPALHLHVEPQDTECHGWKRLLELVDQAASDGREEFAPSKAMDRKDWMQVVTLPLSIAKLKAVKSLYLYSSNLVRIPPEIGEMESLERFDPYTSYRLHWLPYEITRCRRLKVSRVSTRALYGNYKYRPPFPRLPQPHDVLRPSGCSVCGGPFSQEPQQVWISLRVATDVMPLLVHACSDECIRNLPTPAEHYVQHPHQGGLDVKQPTAVDFLGGPPVSKELPKEPGVQAVSEPMATPPPCQPVAQEDHNTPSPLRRVLAALTRIFVRRPVEVPGHPEAAMIRQLQGRTCVYKEHAFIQKVRITEVRVDEWGVLLRLRIVAAKGFSPQQKKSFEAAACWANFSMSELAVWAPGITWYLVTDPSRVERILARAAELGASTNGLSQFISETGFPDGAAMIVKAPGPF